ncbi:MULTISPECIES: hypothetical protein [Brucella/Ochrobactrum group]|uniref:Uncharacterized protein n=2 Tax=Ochrobactrum TaxID=528 RepID=A0ABD5JPZ1_9HYPH|nr:MULTISPECIES: hypothetical protein [Brucella]MCI1001606.1 hypothetical protein [Ochrobactrum sp. C6C9]RRD22085.1 hypothetical protein ECB98_21440 [Brucellaceae bacterium VT-16-1752]WHT42273.1 hypothetical protein QLQ11_01630 [Ochrobactrum sp. SSR]MDX4072450.1 hypothetical protein [Brucella sp. NBRC 113783]RLL75730.1 hypothetical protein D8666_03795 [[Ochrobactrum] soli]
MNVIQINKFATIGLGAVVMLAASMGGSYAAKISNKDSAAQTIVVTEGASKREMVVAPGDTVDFCAAGCFVTFPNGDREALTGDETITITGGKATLK